MTRWNLYRGVRRAVAVAAIASYATIAVVGYGLHDLVGVQHCHDQHCHDAVVDHHACSGHTHEPPVHGDERASLAASCDQCTICALLAQAQSGDVPLPALDGVAPVADAVVATEALLFSLRADSPLARGPPTA